MEEGVLAADVPIEVTVFTVNWYVPGHSGDNIAGEETTFVEYTFPGSSTK